MYHYFILSNINYFPLLIQTYYLLIPYFFYLENVKNYTHASFADYCYYYYT